jgi:hypothetical protein
MFSFSKQPIKHNFAKWGAVGQELLSIELIVDIARECVVDEPAACRNYIGVSNLKSHCQVLFLQTRDCCAGERCKVNSDQMDENS